MASSPVQELVSAQLGAAAAVLYASPTGTWTQLIKLTCCNTDTSVHNVTFYLVPSGGSATSANTTTKAKAILAGDTWNSPNEYAQVLNPGDALYGVCDTAAVVNVFVSGLLVG